MDINLLQVFDTSQDVPDNASFNDLCNQIALAQVHFKIALHAAGLELNPIDSPLLASPLRCQLKSQDLHWCVQDLS